MTGDVRRMALPEQTPLYHAAQSERYERQRLIQEYHILSGDSMPIRYSTLERTIRAASTSFRRARVMG